MKWTCTQQRQHRYGSASSRDGPDARCRREEIDEASGVILISHLVLNSAHLFGCLMTFNRQFGVINLLREVVGGRPLPLGCGGPRARPRFRQVSSIVRRELTRPRGRRPTTRDPGQDPQSLPLLYAMHVTLHTPGVWSMVCLVCVPCYARLLRALCATVIGRGGG